MEGNVKRCIEFYKKKYKNMNNLNTSFESFVNEEKNSLWNKEIYRELERKFGLSRDLISFDYTPGGIKIKVEDYKIFADKFTKGDSRAQIIQSVITRIENYINKKYGKNVKLHEQFTIGEKELGHAYGNYDYKVGDEYVYHGEKGAVRYKITRISDTGVLYGVPIGGSYGTKLNNKGGANIIHDHDKTWKANENILPKPYKKVKCLECGEEVCDNINYKIGHLYNKHNCKPSVGDYKAKRMLKQYFPNIVR
jgi:hypothetical protein